ncbi:Serine/threonine-protein phosphatase 2A activator 2, partial [Massospora cicadina]
MQHFYFGSLISFDTWHNVPGDKCSGESGSKGSDEHSHLAFGQEAPACCGIRVPSAIGAAAFGKPELRDPGIPRPTRLPFD